MIHILNQDLLVNHLRENFGVVNVAAVLSFEEADDPDYVRVAIRHHDGGTSTILLEESFDSLAAVLFDSAPALTRNVEQFPGVSAAGRFAAGHPNGDGAA